MEERERGKGGRVGRVKGKKKEREKDGVRLTSDGRDAVIILVFFSDAGHVSFEFV